MPKYIDIYTIMYCIVSKNNVDHVISFVVHTHTHSDSGMLQSTYSMLSQRCNADDPQEQGGIWCDVAAGCCSAKGARVSRLEISTVQYCNHSRSYVLSPDFVVRFHFSIELKNKKVTVIDLLEVWTVAKIHSTSFTSLLQWQWQNCIVFMRFSEHWKVSCTTDFSAVTCEIGYRLLSFSSGAGFLHQQLLDLRRDHRHLSRFFFGPADTGDSWWNTSSFGVPWSKTGLWRRGLKQKCSWDVYRCVHSTV